MKNGQEGKRQERATIQSASIIGKRCLRAGQTSRRRFWIGEERRLRFCLTQSLAAAGIWLILGGYACAQPSVDHGIWDGILKRHARDGSVDYEAIGRERGLIDRYLESLKEAKVAQLAPKARLAFWINAYNASVITGVLDNRPLKSVKDVAGFFDKIKYRVGGMMLTLNQIEEQGRALGDWRIHFAVVCASSGCPKLRSEAYVAEKLEEQLRDQTVSFLRDRQNGLRFDDETLWVSRIFKWYERDFGFGTASSLFGNLTSDSLVPVISPYLDSDIAGMLRARRRRLKFLKYDWGINDAGIGR